MIKLGQMVLKGVNCVHNDKISSMVLKGVNGYTLYVQFIWFERSQWVHVIELGQMVLKEVIGYTLIKLGQMSFIVYTIDSFQDHMTLILTLCTQ